MKYALLAFLSFVSSPVMAAPVVGASVLVSWVVALIILGIVCGLLILLVRKAPMIPAEFKEWIIYLIYFVVILIVIGWLLGYVARPNFNF